MNSMSAQNQHDNALLAALPSADRARLLAGMQRISLPVGTVLSDSDEPYRRIHFLTSGVVSLVAPMVNGALVEMATVGPEGIVEVNLVLDSRIAMSRNIVQVPVEALAMEYQAFRRSQLELPSLRNALLRFSQAFLKQVLQSVACNAIHSAQQRAARWLLMCEDRNRGRSFALTQEFLGSMLGVSRPHVTTIARALQRDGLIQYRRGMITILDRAGLEQACCECYRLIRKAYDPPSISRQ
jgi:CRP-like cAMP-binding protein